MNGATRNGQINCTIMAFNNINLLSFLKLFPHCIPGNVINMIMVVTLVLMPTNERSFSFLLDGLWACHHNARVAVSLVHVASMSFQQSPCHCTPNDNLQSENTLCETV